MTSIEMNLAGSDLEQLMENQYQHVRIERVGSVAHLILNRPDILNAAWWTALRRRPVRLPPIQSFA